MPRHQRRCGETKLRPAGDRKVYNIVHLIYRSRHDEHHSKDYKVSRLTMEEHWRAGCYDAVRTLRHQEALERPSHLTQICLAPPDPMDGSICRTMARAWGPASHADSRATSPRP